jgi:ATP-dependent DNA helicase RecG
MRAFAAGEIDILVATTVIEVGIDVPNATIMVIEDAGRFGLSQLHQLRGRVGRGGEQSYCILLTDDLGRKRRAALAADRARAQEEDAVSTKRLETMVRTNDGFEIAEVDLALRGPGELFGTRQSGMPEFLVADLATDGEIIARARESAFEIVARDPHLRHPDHGQLRVRFESVYKNLLSFVRTG